MDFHAFEGLSFWVEEEDVLQVAAEPAAEDVDLSLEDWRGMAPAWEKGGAFELDFFPVEGRRVVGVLEEGRKVDLVDVAEAAVLVVASRDDEHFGAD